MCDLSVPSYQLRIDNATNRRILPLERWLLFPYTKPQGASSRMIFSRRLRKNSMGYFLTARHEGSN